MNPEIFFGGEGEGLTPCNFFFRGGGGRPITLTGTNIQYFTTEIA